MESVAIRTERTTTESDTLKVLEKLTPAEKLDAMEFLVGALRRSSNYDASSQSLAMRKLLQQLATTSWRKQELKQFLHSTSTSANSAHSPWCRIEPRGQESLTLAAMAKK